MIKDCKFGIHDILRTELNAEGLPRFNMPFELGIFYGASKFGNKIQKQKNALVLERQKYLYQHYLSDLNGIDTKAHDNDPLEAIQKVRDWLRSASQRKTIPSYNRIKNDYEDFESKLPAIAASLEFEVDNIHFNDLCVIVEGFVAEKGR